MQNDITKELGQNFIEYAVAVNTDRAIPDAKSGLKPVARRLLWCAKAITKCPSNKPHIKSARLVGDAMGRLHPHGDSSLYGTLVRLSQPWEMRYPLFDWHGNNGNQIGDGPAHMRYTECRLAPISEDGMLKHMETNNVDFIPTFDETDEEPMTLPAIFPNLLCNPNAGIGVAKACSWASHNLKEVYEAIKDYLDGKEPMLPGPDFPTGGTIINGNDVPNIMKTGHGSVKIRGNYKVNKNIITFYEIPYGTTVEGLLTEISEVCEKEEIKGIVDARDESNKKGIKIVIECDKGVNPESVVLQLFQKTNLQSSFSYNQVALVGKTPLELNLKDCIKIYVEHNGDCIKREAEYEKVKCENRLEIVEGLLKALADIDAIIEMIKKSNDSKAAAAALVAQWKFTEEQAKAILAMRLSSLTKLDGVELNNEKDTLKNDIDKYASWINDEKARVGVLIERLENLVKKYGDARRTIITNIEEPKAEKEVAAVVPEDVVVVVTKSGLIKRIPKASFKTQRRNGKGTKTLDEALLSVVKTNTIDNVLIFTNSGKMYKLLVDNVPIGTNASKGTNIKQLVKMDTNEEVIAVTTMSYENNSEYVMFFTENGLVKKTVFDEYAKVKRGTGIAAISLKEGDTLASVDFVNTGDIVQIITRGGYSIKFNSNEVAATGRATQGVKGIKLNDDDYVLQGLVVKPGNLAVFSVKGYGKQITPTELTIQARAGKGVKLHPDLVAGAAYIEGVDSFLLIGYPNSICISASDVPITSRIAQGNIMIKDSNMTKVVTL